ncbi:hypothetical protein [Klenkia brasiliensis]|uniref:PH domain-containing protein n=1 Tax=Klenkia brasiliensis TaxID=333142 RepID=A0A1G7L7S0_9ACTN|nr:hypothetical protein [Klenkia brasiliensis]SDF45374.1 hypothetical protein SAMN05660324_0161 [Klenkia brasiliensis]
MTVVDLRQPTLSLVLLAASYVVAVGMVVSVLSFGEDSGFFPYVFVAAVVGITTANTARALSRARTDDQGRLVVRNWFRTTVLQRSDVDRVMTDRAGGPGSLRRIQLLLPDGSGLPLVATEAIPFPGSRQRLEEQAEQLRAWAAGR